jgi:hypothetical protein
LVRACPGQEVCSPWKRTEVSLPGARGPGAGGLLPPRRHRKLVCPGHGPVGPGQEACSPLETPQNESARDTGPGARGRRPVLPGDTPK